MLGNYFGAFYCIATFEGDIQYYYVVAFVRLGVCLIELDLDKTKLRCNRKRSVPWTRKAKDTQKCKINQSQTKKQKNLPSPYTDLLTYVGSDYLCLASCAGLPFCPLNGMKRNKSKSFGDSKQWARQRLIMARSSIHAPSTRTLPPRGTKGAAQPGPEWRLLFHTLSGLRALKLPKFTPQRQGPEWRLIELW